MNVVDYLRNALLVAFAVAAVVPGSAFAQDRDTQEIQSYVLTDAGLAKYQQATKNFAALPARSGSDCEEDEDSDSRSLDELVAKFNAVPGGKAAIQSAGMTTREYFVFTLSIFQNGMAAWALTQPGGKLPAGISKANVDFYNRHAAEFEKLDALKKDDECETRTDEEGNEE